jgi:hypothetical protein
VDAIEVLVRSLPGEAERIRRLYYCDLEFRTVCEDYRDSLEAASRFGAQGLPFAARAEEYRQLAAELLIEAAAMLKEGPS